jgi:hypothetical protein
MSIRGFGNHVNPWFHLLLRVWRLLRPAKNLCIGLALKTVRLFCEKGITEPEKNQPIRISPRPGSGWLSS